MVTIKREWCVPVGYGCKDEGWVSDDVAKEMRER
jgi:hypothetical protein